MAYWLMAVAVLPETLGLVPVTDRTQAQPSVTPEPLWHLDIVTNEKTPYNHND